MSLILDALRRGRAQTRRAYGNGSESDAVLHTLTYQRAARSDSWTTGRIAIYAVAGILVSVVVWSVVVWLTSAWLIRPATRSVPQGSARAGAQPSAQQARPAAPSSPTGRVPPDRVDADDTPNVPGQAAPSGAVPRPTAVAPASPPIAPASDRESFQSALAAHRSGDLDSAVARYTDALRLNPLNVEAHNNLGLIYRERGFFAEAERALQRAIALDPSYARGRNNLGLVYLSQKKFEAAASAFHAALSIEPANLEALVNLALVERESGRREAARKALRDALARDPWHPGARYNLALLEDEAGRPTQAVSHYQTFLRHGADRHQALAADVRRRIVELERVR